MNSPRDLTRVAARLFNAPLLVLPDVAAAIASNLAHRFGVAPMREPDSTAMALVDDDDDAGDEPAGYEVVDGVAVIGVRGELVNRGSWLDAYSGLTSYERLGASLRAAAADDDIAGIVLDIDSPGGEAAGAMEAAASVREAAAAKPVVALINSMAASAAYAIAAGATEIVVTPSAVVGSIGVVWLHMDYSAALAEAGMKPTLLHAGAYKVDGNSLQPLAAEAAARIQGTIAAYYDLFVNSVGAHRPNLGAAGARATEAGMYVGQAGIAAGLADRVGDLAGVISQLKPTPAPPASFFPLRSSAMTETANQEAALAVEVVAARESGRREGIAAERARIGAILTSPDAEGRHAAALAFALETDMSAESALAVLKKTPVASLPAPPAPAGQTRLEREAPRAGIGPGVVDNAPANEFERGRAAFGALFPRKERAA